MKALTEFQHLFNTDLEQLNNANEDDIKFIKQNHSGNLLIEENKEDTNIFRLWRNLDCNGGGIEIEAHTLQTGYKWELIFLTDLN